MKTVVEVLDCTIEFLSDSTHWIKGDYAVRVKGTDQLTNPSQAGACCLVGALRRCAPSIDTRLAFKTPLLNEVEEFGKEAIEATSRKPYETLERWNDDKNRRHPDVLRILRRARALAAAQAAKASA